MVKNEYTFRSLTRNSFWSARTFDSECRVAFHGGLDLVVDGSGDVMGDFARLAPDHHGHSQALARHLQQAGGEGRIRRHAWHGLAAAHQVLDVQQQAPAERATGV